MRGSGDTIQIQDVHHWATGATFHLVLVRLRYGSVPLHVHSEHAVTAFHSPGQAFRSASWGSGVAQGSLAVAGAGVPHANVADQDGVLHFSAIEFDQGAWATATGRPEPFARVATVVRRPAAAQLLTRLGEQAAAGLPDAQLQSGLTRLIRALEDVAVCLSGPPLRFPSCVTQDPLSQVPAEGGDDLAEACTDYLMARSTGRVTRDELARWTGLHPDTIGRRFKRDIGMTTGKFHLAVRLDLARNLLRKRVTPSLAALDAGFVDQAHLTRLFKRHYKMTPGQYQRTLTGAFGTRLS